MHDPEFDPLSGRVMLGFVLTLIAVPILFVVTCMPLGAAVVDTAAFLPIVIVYSVIFIGAAIILAARTRNPGIRWAIIAVLVLALFRGAVLLFNY